MMSETDIAFVDDLMDRSRICAAFPQIRFISDPRECSDARLVIVDITRHGIHIEEIRRLLPHAHIVGFGPHVDEEIMKQARDRGVDIALPRSRFFRDVAAACAPDDPHPSHTMGQG